MGDPIGSSRERGRRLGPYVLDRRIGAGGMAEVFLAHQVGVEGFSRPVAIKTIAGHGADREGVKLFLDEARAASNLDHSAIVRTLDLGLDDDTLYIVMEYVDGPPLSRILKELKERGRGLVPSLIAHIGARIAEALDYAHHRATSADGRSLDLVHRDISPHNVLITRQGAAKLTDFGIARSAIQHHVTRTGMVRGKAAYMAPEQVSAKAIDGRTDIFGLGVVLYEAACLVRPFERADELSTMKAVLKDEVQDVRTLNPHLPEALAKVIHRCLEKDPAARFLRAEELARALSAAAGSDGPAKLELGWSQLVSGLFGRGGIESDGAAVEAWHPTVRDRDAMRATPSSPSTPSSLAEILLELSPSPSRPAISAGPPDPLLAPTPQVTASPSITEVRASRSPSIAPWIAAAVVLVLLGTTLGLLIGRQGPAPTAPPETPTAIVEARPAVEAPVIEASPKKQPIQVRVAAPLPAPKPPPRVVDLQPRPLPPVKVEPPVAPDPFRGLGVRLERAERGDPSAKELAAIGEAIAEAADALGDSAARARIQRSARASADLGDVSGLKRAFTELRSASSGGSSK